VSPGESYFLIQIQSAQAAFHGSIWERVKRLIITSQVALKHPRLGGEALRAIQRSREVKQNRAEQLGLSPNLIDLVPATMSSVSISIEFLLDKENRLAQLAELANHSELYSAISLAPGAVAVAKTISGLAGKLITAFLPAEESQPILQFAGDFNLATDGLRDGYYVILGTRDERNPIPHPLPKLEVRDGDLLADGQGITQLSYVVLDVRSTPARTRELNDGAAWEDKLRQAEMAADALAGDMSEQELSEAWQRCKRLVLEGQALLAADPNYLRREATAIFKGVYAYCEAQVTGARASRGGLTAPAWAPDTAADRTFMGIPAEEDLDATAVGYAEQVVEARQVLSAARLM
jgi:hypothetical protein